MDYKWYKKNSLVEMQKKEYMTNIRIINRGGGVIDKGSRVNITDKFKGVTIKSKSGVTVSRINPIDIDIAYS